MLLRRGGCLKALTGCCLPRPCFLLALPRVVCLVLPGLLMIVVLALRVLLHVVRGVRIARAVSVAARMSCACCCSCVALFLKIVVFFFLKSLPRMPFIRVGRAASLLAYPFAPQGPRARRFPPGFRESPRELTLLKVFAIIVFWLGYAKI